MKTNELIKTLKDHISNCETLGNATTRIWKKELVSIVDVLELMKCCGNCHLEDLSYGGNECPHYHDCKRVMIKPDGFIDYWQEIK
jgi:hypothetical protein